MRLGIRLIVLSWIAISACSQAGQGSTPSPTGAPEAGTVSASPLEGEWDTGPYAAHRVRDAIIAAGYTSAEANEVVGKKKRYEFDLTFYEEEGAPFVVATGWDPTKGTQPADGDHGPYLLLPGNKLKITCDVCDIHTNYMLFSYELEGKTLTLRFIRNVNPNASAYDRRFATAYGITWTAAPFHKVG